MRETYQIFMDSGTGLLTGALSLNSQDCSGTIEMYGHPLELSDVSFDGNKRSFNGTLPASNPPISFTAEGELEDEVLDVMVKAAGQQILITGFLKEDKT